MSKNNGIDGFSKMTKDQKIDWLISTYFDGAIESKNLLTSFWLDNATDQKAIDNFSENVLSNYILPFSVAPNFLIDGEIYTVPMVIEESSVVAAASSAAKFWMTRGGIRTEIIETKKVGHVNFTWSGSLEMLEEKKSEIFAHLLESTQCLTENMVKRGGGVLDLCFIDLGSQVTNAFQLVAQFETCDSMGANFINTILEQFAKDLIQLINIDSIYGQEYAELEIVMSILSNYTPKCLVRASVSCAIAELGDPINGQDADKLARKFKTAVDIARADVYRATTHNKGIFNGIDAVVLATGNDFRAIEACGHAYAARDGQYRSLSYCSIDDDQFTFTLEIPLAVGTIGGLTSLHPLAKCALHILGNPSASQLMSIIAATGLAQNFAAVKSLVTTGIQKGHMRMHLQNIMQQIGVEESNIEKVKAYFENKTISFSAVRTYIDSIN
jgi:hydroxymethylglutaryl-CoA reductase